MEVDVAAEILSDRFTPAGDKASFIDFSKYFQISGQALKCSLINFS